VIRKSLGLLLCGAAFNGAFGQTKDVKDVLADAKTAYQASNFEQARQLLNTVLNTKQQVTAQQKVTAYTYLGAYWALQGSTGAPRDSALSYFIAAIDIDPFTTLDPAIFFSDEQAAFAYAQSQKFRVGMDPMHAQNLNPNPLIRDTVRTSYSIRAVTTQQATISPRIQLVANPNYSEPLPQINNKGVTNIQWNGLVNGQRADTGVYEFVVAAVSSSGNGRDSVKQRFRIEYVHAPLEDTLPSFQDAARNGTDTLVSVRAGTVPYTNGLKGVFAGLVAGGLPFITFSDRSNMSSWTSHVALGALVGFGAGAVAGFYANNHRVDSKAAAENKRRVDLRTSFNAGVRARNQARLDRTILVIRPLTVSSAGN
jgi:hypothetical protein